MYKVVKLGTKEVPMLANAATSIRYKQVFGKELFKQMQDAQENLSVEIIMELAYIMAMAGGKQDMNKLNADTYMAWLEGFEFNDFIEGDVTTEIITVWQGNIAQEVEPKKEAVQPSEN